MKPELLRKVMAKLDAIVLETVDFLGKGNTYLSEKRKRMAARGIWIKSPERAKYNEWYRQVPDKEFEKIMSSVENMPRDIHKSFKAALEHLPKDRGGRPSEFLPEI